jgi:hypothetical protein
MASRIDPVSVVAIPIETGHVVDQLLGILAVDLDTPQGLGFFPINEESDLLTVG